MFPCHLRALISTLAVLQQEGVEEDMVCGGGEKPVLPPLSSVVKEKAGSHGLLV